MPSPLSSHNCSHRTPADSMKGRRAHRRSGVEPTASLARQLYILNGAATHYECVHKSLLCSLQCFFFCLLLSALGKYGVDHHKRNRWGNYSKNDQLLLMRSKIRLGVSGTTRQVKDNTIPFDDLRGDVTASHRVVKNIRTRYTGT